MNQRILFVDGFSVNEEGLILTAMVSGALVQCIVTDIYSNDAKCFYEEYQFSMEELFAEIIEDYEGVDRVTCSKIQVTLY